MNLEIERAVQLLQAGEVVGLPTETVYGLAADATNPRAVARIFELKGRPRGHPLIVHIGSAEWLDTFCCDVPAEACALAAAFWPGPLSMVLRRNASAVPDEVTGGLETVAVRLPAHPIALGVLLQLQRPLAAPSANRFGAVSPTTKQHVLDDLGGQLPLVLEGGPCRVGVESTIVDLAGETPRLLRPGKVTRGELEAVLKKRVLDDDGLGAKAPGTLASHYCPRARVEVFASAVHMARRAEELAEVEPLLGVISDGCSELRFDFPRAVVKTLGPSEEALAHQLYACLRSLDAAGCSVILSCLPPPTGLGEAIFDRLTRAACPQRDLTRS